MPSFLQRKYIDLIYQVSSQWINWDPHSEIRVGAYGTIDKETGNLLVEGNIYDPEFMRELRKRDVRIHLANFPPQEGPVESDLIIASHGAKRRELNTNHAADALSIASAAVKAQWSFQSGKRGAVLIMHNPRQICLPPNLDLDSFFRIDKLIDKWLVTKTHVCPAYSMYLSDKSGDKVSFALFPQAPMMGVAGIAAGSSGSVGWFIDAQTGLLRRAWNQTGKYVFTPPIALRRPIKRLKQTTRDTIRPQSTGDGGGDSAD